MKANGSSHPSTIPTPYLDRLLASEGNGMTAEPTPILDSILTSNSTRPYPPADSCLCGCGEQASKRFVRGHHKSLQHRVMLAAKSGTLAEVSHGAAAYLADYPWAKGAFVVR